MFSNRTAWNRATNRLSEALARYRTSGEPFFDLSISNPTECGFHYDERAIMRAKTDSGSEIRFSNEPEKAGVHNLLSIYQVLTKKSSEE